MYAPLLTNRYLTSRVIPLIAVGAVALCVALVIVVMSVMSGFLDLLLSSGRSLMGDVIVTYPVRGIPYYDRLIREIEALPEAEAATPLINTVGLMRMPYPEGNQKDLVTCQVWAVEPESFAKVIDYEKSLYWGPERAQVQSMDGMDVISNRSPKQLKEGGLTLHDPVSGKPGVVVGMHVSILNKRTHEGQYRPHYANWYLPNYSVSLLLAPTSIDDRTHTLDEDMLKDVSFPVLNEMFTGVYQVDKQRVLMPLDDAQQMLRMGKADRVDPNLLDPDTGLPATLGEDPARATMILVRAKEGVTPGALAERVRQVYEEFWQKFPDERDPEVRDYFVRLTSLGHEAPYPPSPAFVMVKTWEEQLADLIGPVKKERELLRALFSIVNIVCAALILSIFWAIVYEKTRDIGILRSVGASRIGIVWIFLRYGLAVGIVGSMVGAGMGWLVTTNINGIQTVLANPPAWLVSVLVVATLIVMGQTGWNFAKGRFLPIVIGIMLSVVVGGVAFLVYWLRRVGGVEIWNPEVYYFNSIPNTVDWFSAMFTMIGAVVFSLIGAAFPAAKAADTDPVQALRYE